jgi:energy-coupling factor transport system substrate-specific component
MGVTAQPERGPMRRTEAVPYRTPAVAVIGAAMLLFFILWIPFYWWLDRTWPSQDQSNNLVLGIASAVFWLVVAVIVVAAVRWTRTAFEAWTTADLMLTAVLGAVFGGLFFLWAFVYNAVAPALQTIPGDWSALVNGFWFIPAILVPYIIRKPGAALVGETLAGVIAVLLGSPWGIIGSAIAGLTQGLGAEIVFALTGWKRYDWLTLALAGVGAQITGFVYVYPIWNSGLNPALLAVNFIAGLISVLVFAVAGSKLIGDALLTTGVLDRFAIGRERMAGRQAGEEF